MRYAADHHHFPAVLGEMPVVISAEQAHLIDVRLTAVDPVADVMDLRPSRRAVASREAAAAVAGGQREALSGGGEPTAAAVGEDAAGLICKWPR